MIIISANSSEATRVDRVSVTLTLCSTSCPAGSFKLIGKASRRSISRRRGKSGNDSVASTAPTWILKIVGNVS